MTAQNGEPDPGGGAPVPPFARGGVTGVELRRATRLIWLGGPVEDQSTDDARDVVAEWDAMFGFGERIAVVVGDAIRRLQALGFESVLGTCLAGGPGLDPVVAAATVEFSEVESAVTLEDLAEQLCEVTCDSVVDAGGSILNVVPEAFRRGVHEERGFRLDWAESSGVVHTGTWFVASDVTTEERIVTVAAETTDIGFGRDLHDGIASLALELAKGA